MRTYEGDPERLEHGYTQRRQSPVPTPKVGFCGLTHDDRWIPRLCGKQGKKGKG